MIKKIAGSRADLRPASAGAAAIDIGSRMHMAAVNPDSTDDPVRAFGTFTQDLHAIADWFKTCGVTSIAMESTGVYWIPAYEILEQRGFDGRIQVPERTPPGRFHLLAGQSRYQYPKVLPRCREVQCLTGPSVQAVRHGVEVALIELRQGRPFREVLPQ